MPGIVGLDPNADKRCRAVYERTRTALVGQLKRCDPPLAESGIEREYQSFAEVVREDRQRAGQSLYISVRRPQQREELADIITSSARPPGGIANYTFAIS